MKEVVLMDNRLKSKIESISQGSSECYVAKFKDLDDSFWFSSKEDLQEFIRAQEVERFFDKSLRKGYFDYINEYKETFRYYVECERGKLTLISEEFIDS